jgi:alanine racemase
MVREKLADKCLASKFMYTLLLSNSSINVYVKDAPANVSSLVSGALERFSMSTAQQYVAAPDAVTDPISMVVDLDAIRRNYATVKGMVGEHTQIIPSIKGDGYGIGAAAAAAVFKECGAYSVATGAVNDAMAIRRSGNDMRIHMFPGILPEAMPLLFEYKLTPSIYNKELAQAASAAAKEKWGVFIKVDSGFGRLGVPVDRALEFVKEVAALPNLWIEGIFTHVPYGDEPGREWAIQAIGRFRGLVEALKNEGFDIPITQCVASKSTLHGLYAEDGCNAISVGHLFFGGLGREPLGEEKTSKLVPAIQKVTARLIHVRHHDREGTIGSGGKIPVKAGTITGTIPVGLHEGYRSAAPGKISYVLVQGKRCRVYFVSQEYTAIDLSQIDNPSIGDEVVVFGSDGSDRISVEEMADWQGQSALHVVMNMNGRFPIRFLNVAAK